MRQKVLRVRTNSEASNPARVRLGDSPSGIQSLCVYGEQSVEMGALLADFRMFFEARYKDVSAERAWLEANIAGVHVARLHPMAPLTGQESATRHNVDGFIAEHSLHQAVEAVTDNVLKLAPDGTRISLQVIEGDFDGESLLELMVSTDLDPDSTCVLDEEIHRQMAESVPLDKRVFLVVNFRAG